jgi:hypothetical protein
LIRNGGSKYYGGSIYHTGGVQFSIRGFNIPWMKIDPGVNLPWGSKYHMTPVHSLKNYGPLNSQATGKGEK